MDGNVVSCAGVTAGLDGALVVASLLRGDATAEEIQLDIEYSPEPVFHSGTPETASAEVPLWKGADREDYPPGCSLARNQT